MKCADCGRFPNPDTGGLGWYAATESINYCPTCKDFRGLSKWAKARDWELVECVRRGWPQEAIAEAKRRNLPLERPEPRQGEGTYWSRKP